MSDSGFLGTGWAYPPAFDRASAQVRMSSGVDNIEQAINVLLKTPKGSRCLMPTFGCNLSNYTFRRIDASAREQIIQAVSSALLEGEPRIDVERVDVALAADGTQLQLTLRYVVRQTNSRHNHVFPFSLLEGTNLEIGS